MYAILNERIALRAYQLVPYSYITKTSKIPNKLSKEEFDILIKADGKQDITLDEIAKTLLEKGAIKQCEKNEFSLSDWQVFRNYDNRLVHSMNFQITGLCNYNCLHCFNAKDNERLQSQMTYEQVIDVLDQAKNCGITAITLTGGEPLIHKNIREIIKAIYERDMFVDEINTNGAFITQDFLDFIKSFNYPTLMKISFDGVGFHDLIRNHTGAEKLAIEAFKLCIKNGFPVMAQVNVNKNNISSMPKTIELLDSLKVNVIRIIRTSESPRWQQNNGQSLSVKEYYDSMLDLMADYIKKPRFSVIVVWHFLTINPMSKQYSMDAISDVRLSKPLCGRARGMVDVAANGNVYPCLQMSGAMDERGIVLGNVFKDGFHNIFQSESEYMKYVCMSIEQKASLNGKCQNCEYLKHCGTGCPAMSLAFSIIEENKFDYTYPDKMRCYFYENDYYHKVLKALNTYKCMSSLYNFKKIDMKTIKKNA